MLFYHRTLSKYYCHTNIKVGYLEPPPWSVVELQIYQPNTQKNPVYFVLKILVFANSDKKKIKIFNTINSAALRTKEYNNIGEDLHKYELDVFTTQHINLM